MESRKHEHTKKEAYIDNMAHQLKKWSARIDELESRTGQAAADVKAGYVRTIADLKVKRDILAGEIRDLKESGGEAWENVKTGVDNAWEDLKNAVHAAKERFTHKKAA